ncbi:MAG: diacylglycerol kinase family protein [Deltaproteobacteria bacterium]|nr:diacylglycerol kinase family protein [Deltaproteobacteria bacterium]
MSFSMKKRAISFIYAFSGIKTLVLTQHNAWCHLFATLAVVSAGVLFELTGVEWSMIIISIVFVWMAEALNTAVEFLADSITKEQNQLIGKAKDVAAGGVLIASFGAVAVGLFVFWPHLVELDCEHTFERVIK